MEEFIDDLPDKISGKKIFSFTLPKTLSIEYKPSTSRFCAKCGKECEQDGVVVIKNGELKTGVIDDNSLGEKKGKLINKIEQISPEEARIFIDRVSRLGLEMITRTGFSIAVSDEDISTRARNKIKTVLEECESEVSKEIKSFVAGKSAKTHGLSAKELLETTIRRLTGEASKKASEVIKGDLPFNSAVIMAKTGARGSYVNLTQMCAFVGQKSL